MQEQAVQTTMANLTSREQEILHLILEGDSSKEIAFKLKISPRTIDFHRNNINKKLDVGNYYELIVKYSSIKNKQEESKTLTQTELVNSHPVKTNKMYKFLIPSAVFVLICSLIPLWYFTIKGSSITLEETSAAPAFIDRTFDTVYLRPGRFNNTEKGYHGETYYSYDEIKLRDFYTGTLDELIPNAYEWYTVRISGTAETELKYVKINLQIRPYGNGDWIFIGDSDPNYYNIGPGDFSEEVKFCKLYNNLSEFPAGEVLFIISSGLYLVNYDENPFSFDTGIRLPENVSYREILATIHNFKIEPVF
jgi:DNA-binding CsgD family transcriptional regulator